MNECSVDYDDVVRLSRLSRESWCFRWWSWKLRSYCYDCCMFCLHGMGLINI